MSLLCPSCGHMPDTPAHALGCREERPTEQLVKDTCDRINERIGWRGSDPEFLLDSSAANVGYTGRVVLSARAAVEIARLLEAR